MPNYEGKERRDQHWHLDKKFNIGHFLTTLGMAGAVFVWAMTMESRIATQEVKIDNNKQRIESVETRTVKALDDVNKSIEGLSSKLDRLIENVLLANSRYQE